VFEAFSVSHVGILNGTTSFTDAVNTMGDIYGVRTASIEADMGEFDNAGDDALLSNWQWFNKGTLNVVAGYISFDLLNTMTSEAIGSSAAGSSVAYYFPLWSTSQMNIAPKPVIVKCPAKDADGTVRQLILGLYKVQFGPMRIEGPAYKEGLAVSFSGAILKSAIDEVGNALAVQAAGRILYVAAPA
jgi:hypothetical protein